YYNEVHTKNGGKASDCIKCGKCENACPQHLPIRDLLQEVAKEFEK
ncbi:MAG: 4Fe-4S dicluster domain-containing protein, partial [Treponemataceae bacterium]|nr:4Fe-4S dicluster domain-containing protein [Treponemataceae bacterium]